MSVITDIVLCKSIMKDSGILELQQWLIANEHPILTEVHSHVNKDVKGYAFQGGRFG